MAMRRDEAICRIREHEEELRQFHFAALSLFGSVARDEATESSDVDILVDFATPPRFRQFMGLKFALERILGTGVDLVDRAALREAWREVIEADSQLVA